MSNSTLDMNRLPSFIVRFNVISVYSVVKTDEKPLI